MIRVFNKEENAKSCEISARDLRKPFREYKNRKFLLVSKC
jgi:hypothetical protein